MKPDYLVEHRASLADAVGWFRGALRVRDRGNVPQGRSGDGGAVPHGDWYLLSKRRSRWPGRSAGCRPIPSNRARQKARQPASPRPRTRSSNPVPSSEESANHQFLSSGAHHCGRLDRKTELNDPDWTVGVKLGRDDKRGFWLLDVVRARASLSSQHAVRNRAASTNWASDRSPPPDNRIRLRDSETRVEAITNFEYLHAGCNRARSAWSRVATMLRLWNWSTDHRLRWLGSISAVAASRSTTTSR